MADPISMAQLLGAAMGGGGISGGVVGGLLRVHMKYTIRNQDAQGLAIQAATARAESAEKSAAKAHARIDVLEAKQS